MNLLKLGLLWAFFVAPACLAGQAPALPATSSIVTRATASIEFQQLDAADDDAQAEVDKWVQENKQQKANGGGISDAELERRIAERFEPVRKGYEDFLKRNPTDARAHLAYGNFLNARQEEHGAQLEWEKALALDTNNPAIYNNLAGRYGESGPVDKAFEYFARAIELSPEEPAYYHNFADVLYVLRKQASAHYRISEQQVYGRCLMMYSNALRLDPKNFGFARDLAQTYYPLKPLPIDDGLAAWTNALKLAQVEGDRQDVYVHLARLKMFAGRFDEARAQLTAVTNETCALAKVSLLKNIGERQASATRNDPKSTENR